MPCTQYRATGRGAARGTCDWLGFYRRGTTGATARRTGAVPCWLASSYRHSAAGLMARNKGQRELDFTLAFYVAKITGPRWNIPHTGRDCPASAESWKSRLFIIRGVVCVANHAAQFHRQNILSRVLFCCPFFSYVLYLNIEKEMSGKLPAGISFPKACTFEKICYNIFCSCRSDGMADVTDSKSVGSDTVRVQVPPSAPWRVLLQRLKGC